jgi:LysR family glycine cleavage system transcriptional activator
MADPLAGIPLSSLRVFEAAARLGSFTRAAEDLGITQAAVSWQVKALEQRLGLSLFRRMPREVVLTAAGERLARGTGEAMESLRSALADLSDRGEGVLAITTLQTLGTQWLAPRLGAFQLAHPTIAVRLETSSRLVDLLREDADVAVRAGKGEWPGLETQLLFPGLMTPLCSPEFYARMGAPEDPATLLDAPRIGLASEWAAWFEAVGVASPDGVAGTPRLVADVQVLEMALAMTDQGIALGSPILFGGEIAAGRLVQPFETAVRFGGDYWLAYPKDRRRARKIAAFREWLLGLVAEDPVIRRYVAQAA